MGRSVVDAYLGARPPSSMEIERMMHGHQQASQMFGVNYQPMEAALVYTNTDLLEEFKQNAIDSGVMMDQLEVVRYTSDNIYHMSRRSTAILANMPAADHSTLISYNISAYSLTDEEIRDHSIYHTGIDYGENQSLSVHMDDVEIPSEEERLSIAYNNQLLELMIKHELDEEYE